MTQRSIPQNSVTCETYKFEFSLGRKPRGTRGNWAFAFDREERDIRWYYGSFSLAKREAMKQAAHEGINKIYVLP